MTIRLGTQRFPLHVIKHFVEYYAVCRDSCRYMCLSVSSIAIHSLMLQGFLFVECALKECLEHRFIGALQEFPGQGLHDGLRWL
ncbi:hypothetical protein R1flu_009194 [Riccia fluitans]|uniref:Uncharacterized protein n=1 Tax=Riccia fluitans TaxID=41844 RepID=A0ABD1Z1E7_9MARC